MTLLLRKAWRDLRLRPARSLLTLVGIVVGVAGVVAVALAGRAFAEAQRQIYRNQTRADIDADVWNLDETTVQAIAALPGVAAAERRAMYWTQWRTQLHWMDLYLLGVEDFADMRVDRTQLLEGRFPQRGEIALETTARELAAVEIGQTIELHDAQGKVQTFVVSGFTRTPYYPSAQLMRLTIAYAPAATVRKYLEARGDNALLIRLQDLSQAETVRDQIESLLDRRAIRHGALYVRDPDAYIGRREIQTVLRLLTVLSMLGVIVSAFLVTNTLAAIISEEVYEIGILKALGTPRLQILRVYLGTGLVYGLVGTAAGLGLGWWGGWALVRYAGYLLNMDVGHFSPDLLATALGVLVGLGVTVPAGLFPAWRATRLTVRQMLQGYGIQAEAGEWALRRLALPPLWAFPIRNLARRPGRGLTTVLVTAVAVAAFLAARATQTSLNRSVQSLFGIYDSDAWIWFQQPVEATMAGALPTVPGVAEAEGWIISSCVLQGQYVRLWGLPAETTQYRHNLVAGRWYREGEPDAAVISLDLARQQGWQVGDVAEIEVGWKPRRFAIVGIVRDEAIYGLGDSPTGKVFLPLSIVQQMFGIRGRVSFFALRLERHDRAGINSILAEVERKYRSLEPIVEPLYVGYDQAQEGIRAVRALLGAMTATVGAVGLVGILNTQTLNIIERRREIGVLRAVGTRRGHLLRFFVVEGVALGLVGFLLAVPAGWSVAHLLIAIISDALFALRFTVPTSDVLLSLLFALALSVIGGVVPALAAARLRTAEILRYE